MENRRWRTAHRGPLLIHASAWFDECAVTVDIARAVRIARREAARQGLPPPAKPTLDALRAGCGRIVGRVDLRDCCPVEDMPRITRSAWFDGAVGWMLDAPETLAEPVPYRGALGLFDVPETLLSEMCRV